MHLLLFSLLLSIAAAAQAPDKVYVNGTIVTMDARGTVAEAVAVRGGRIVAAGPATEIRKLGGRIIDLRGRTMLPGFYAAHDHFPQIGVMMTTQVDLNSPPMGPVGSMDDIVRCSGKGPQRRRRASG